MTLKRLGDRGKFYFLRQASKASFSHLLIPYMREFEQLRLVLRGRHSIWGLSGSFCVAGAAL